MKILAIDTSCDETAVSVTEGPRILSNIIWSQASLHAKWGGVYPSLAKRAHEERIDWVMQRALKTAFPKTQCSIYQLLATDVNVVAVTIGPGLAIALEVGIKKAKEIAKKYNKPLEAVNHVEGHMLSVLARPNNFKTLKLKNKTLNTNNQSLIFPVLSFVASGGTTQLILINKVGDYKILAQTIDDTLGEALDKAARMLGLGYPGGAVLEKLAKDGDPNAYSLPIPLIGQEERMEFSYSGLKTAMYKIVENEKPLTAEKIQGLAASFQYIAFQHAERLIIKAMKNYPVKNFFFGGGVSANIELRKRLRKICKERKIKMWIPYSKKLCTDNAAMIGIAAGFKYKRGETLYPDNLERVERIPRARVDQNFPWEK